MSWDYDEDAIDAGGRAKAGVYLAEVSSAEERTSGAGDDMVNIALVDATSRKFLCYDNVMMAGKGVGIGLKKALGMGVAERYEEGGKKRIKVYDVARWKGSRTVVKIIEGFYIKDGQKKKRMEPDFDSDGFGYAPEEQWDEIKERSFGGSASDVVEDDDIPF